MDCIECFAPTDDELCPDCRALVAPPAATEDVGTTDPSPAATTDDVLNRIDCALADDFDDLPLHGLDAPVIDVLPRRPVETVVPTPALADPATRCAGCGTPGRQLGDPRGVTGPLLIGREGERRCEPCRVAHLISTHPVVPHGADISRLAPGTYARPDGTHLVIGAGTC